MNEVDPAADRVLAAGGIVRRGDGRIVVVHRDRYDDWSLPKGKGEPGEPPEITALREVEEETGIRCRLGGEVDSTTYRDSKGRRKIVRYWLMEPIEDRGFVADDEIDDIRWCTPTEAATLLTYAHDRALVTAVAAASGARNDRGRNDS